MIFRHPLILVGALTFQRVPTIYSVIHFSHNSWIAYLIFLIFLGGLLIIFVYLSALIPNEVFSPSFSQSISSLLLIFLILLMCSNVRKLKTETSITKAVSEYSRLFYENIFLFIIIYLFVCLTTTMFITSKYKTPIKGFFYDKYTKNPPSYKNRQ